jgi:hypothetical protein
MTLIIITATALSIGIIITLFEENLKENSDERI